jgi:hypothetical protein
MKQNYINSNNIQNSQSLYYNNPFSSEILRKLKFHHTNKSSSNICNSFTKNTLHNFKLLNISEGLLKSSSIPAMNCEFIFAEQKEQNKKKVKLLYQHNHNTNNVSNINGISLYYSKSLMKNKSKTQKTRNMQRNNSYSNLTNDLFSSIYQKYHSYMNGNYLKKKDKSSLEKVNHIKEEQKKLDENSMFTITKELNKIKPLGDSKNGGNYNGTGKKFTVNRIKRISQNLNYDKYISNVSNLSIEKHNNIMHNENISIKPKSHRIQNMKELYKYITIQQP